MTAESETDWGFVLSVIFFVHHIVGYIFWSIPVIYGYLTFHQKPKLPYHKNGGRCSGVSIVKPVCGVHSLLEESLESYFTLKYPKFELLFCAHDDKDPALLIVDRLCKKYPDVDVRYFIGGKPDIVNPMVQNMAPAYENSKYDFVWISSARVKVNTEVICDLVEKAQSPKVALVHQLPFVNDQEGLSNIVEKLYFACSYARKYITVHVWGFVCVCGMSYLINKQMLEDVGGLAFYGRYLSEDQFLAEALHRKGYKLRLSAFPAIQNAAQSQNSLQEHITRLIRWYRLRAIMMPVRALLLENIYECFPNGLLGSWAAYTLFGINPFLVFIVHVSIWLVRDYVSLRIIQNGSLNFSLKTFVCVWFFEELLKGVIVVVALTAPRTIIWGNKTFRLTFRGLAILQEDKTLRTSKHS